MSMITLKKNNKQKKTLLFWLLNFLFFLLYRSLFGYDADYYKMTTTLINFASKMHLHVL